MPTETWPRKKCHSCSGVGEEIDLKQTGRMLTKRRMERGVSQAKLARQMGISYAQLSYLESGDRGFTAEMARKYERALAELGGKVAA